MARRVGSGGNATAGELDELEGSKETIDVSIAEGDRRHGDVRHYGVIASDLEPLDKVVRALPVPDRRLHFVYEAGPCGFGSLAYYLLGTKPFLEEVRQFWRTVKEALARNVLEKFPDIAHRPGSVPSD